MIKHAHHEFDVDVPGKDSWVHRQSGAAEVLVSSTRRWALMHELRGADEPKLPELLAKMSRVDLVLIEGFKREPHRKIEVHRAANGKPACCSPTTPISSASPPTPGLKPRFPPPISMISKAIAAMVHASAVDTRRRVLKQQRSAEG